MTVPCGVSPAKFGRRFADGRQRASLPRSCAHPRRGKRRDPTVIPPRAAKDDAVVRAEDADMIRGADRTGIVRVNRGDPGHLHEMIGKDFVTGRH